MVESIDAAHWHISPSPRPAVHLELRDPAGWWAAIAKWDGCVNLWQFHGRPLQAHEVVDIEHELPNNPTYLHVCKIDELIARLQELRDKAKERFGEDWPA